MPKAMRQCIPAKQFTIVDALNKSSFIRFNGVRLIYYTILPFDKYVLISHLLFMVLVIKYLYKYMIHTLETKKKQYIAKNNDIKCC